MRGLKFTVLTVLFIALAGFLTWRFVLGSGFVGEFHLRPGSWPTNQASTYSSTIAAKPTSDDRTVPPHVVLAIPQQHKFLWISGETKNEALIFEGGNAEVARNGSRITVEGAARFHYKSHEIVLSRSDVVVDGRSLQGSDNWVLLPNGDLTQGFIRTFD